MMHPEAVSSLFHGWPRSFQRKGRKRLIVDCLRGGDVKTKRMGPSKEETSCQSVEFKSPVSVGSNLILTPATQYETSVTIPSETSSSSGLSMYIKASTSGADNFSQDPLSLSNEFYTKDAIERIGAKRRTVKPIQIKREKTHDNEDSSLTKINMPTERSGRKAEKKHYELPLVTTIPIGGKEFIASILAATSEESSCSRKSSDENDAPTVSSEALTKDKVIQLSGDHTYFEFKSPKKKVILKITKNPEKPTDRIKSLEELVDVLIRENLLDSEARCMVEAFLDLPNGLIKNRSQNCAVFRPHMKYTKGVEKFASTIYFHSPRAYEFVSKIFLLPEPSAVRNTVRVGNYFPGFTQEALSILKNGFCNASCTTKLCSVMIVNVKIKEHCEFDADSGRDIGHVDFGGGQDPQDSDEVPVATDALLFVAVGLASNWKLPFGYFLNNNLSGEFLKSLVTEAVRALEESHLEVRAVVCDGHGAFLSLANLLGCKVKVKSFRDIETDFPHPFASDRKIQMIFDAGYGLKLLRNLLADKGSLQSTTYGKIEWKFLRLLLDSSDSDKLHDGPGQKEYMEFYRQKMKIKVGSHSIGNSIGKTLELIEEQFSEEFEGYASTANFAADIDRAFDTLNSRNPVAPGERSPMYQYTVEEQKESLTFVARRMMGLELVSGKRVVDEGRRMSVITFAFTLKAVCQLASDLVNRGVVRYLCTYRLNLQHAEVILSCLQRIGGWSRQPSAAELRIAYEKLLKRASVILKNNTLFTNDFEGEDLTVSQGIIYPYRNRSHEQVFDVGNVIVSNSSLVDYGSEGMCRARYIAHHVARKLACSECIEILLDDDYDSIFMKSETSEIQLNPSEFVLKLLKTSEKISKVQLLQSQSGEIEQLVPLVFCEYSQLNQELGVKENSIMHYLEEPHHVICLTKAVIRTFLSFRQKSYSPILK